MKSEKKVSVIIAVYNVEKYLRECLDSVSGQTYRNLEIICVNDGSVDASSEILREYAKSDNRIKIINKDNEGLGGASARNLGLDNIQGDYVSILDSDDFFDDTMLEKAVKRAEDFDSEIVIFGGYEYDDRSRNQRKITGILNERLIPEKKVFSYKDCPDYFFQISQGMAWNKLFRRDFLSKYGIRFQRIMFTDDAFFTFSNMAMAEKITVLNEPLCHYRVNTGSNQTGNMSKCPDSAYLPYLKLKEFLEKKGIFHELERSFVNLSAEFARFFYDNTNTVESFEYLHNKLKYEIFDKLNISGHSSEYFRDKRCAQWVKEIQSYSAPEMLFISARAHGDGSSTTGIMRFQFPYDKIPTGSKVALIGSRIAGRYYYSQAVLKGNIDIVIWADDENPENLSLIKKIVDLSMVEFDYVLISYHEEDRIKKMIGILRDLGMSDDRIIVGEEADAL